MLKIVMKENCSHLSGIKNDFISREKYGEMYGWIRKFLK